MHLGDPKAGASDVTIPQLVSQIRALTAGPVSTQVESRIKEFAAVHSNGNDVWFSELCFCILTANSSARLGMKIQETLGAGGFLELTREEIAQRLRELGHRYSERRADFIVMARDFRGIKDIVTCIDDEKKAREWLADNIMGLGYKEASHFLRNVGYNNVAILDRHVLRIMKDYDIIEEVPKALAKRMYLEYEKRLTSLAIQVGMTLSRLDLYLWYMKTGAVLK
jgi:N-glycosylase/DNA lyase